MSEDLITRALLGARVLRPYYARAIASLAPVAREAMTSPAAVDRWWRLYYNPTLFASYSDREQAALIAEHEVEHLLRRHASRIGTRNQQLWNVAGDAEINDDGPNVPANGVRPSTIGAAEGLLAETYYDMIEDQATTVACGSGAGNPIPGELGPDGGVSEAEGEVITHQVAADVLRAHAEAPGTVPAGIVMWAEAEVAPVRLPWRVRLTSALRHSLARGRTDYSWRRLGRRHSEAAPLRPGCVSHRPRVALIVDTSGSMSELGAVVLGTVRAVKRLGYEVAEIQCDAEAKKHHHRQAWTGGGGTDLREALTMVKRTRVAGVVVVTDCETPWPDTWSGPPVTVVALGDAPCPPWAIRITP